MRGGLLTWSCGQQHPYQGATRPLASSSHHTIPHTHTHTLTSHTHPPCHPHTLPTHPLTSHPTQVDVYCHMGQSLDPHPLVPLSPLTNLSLPPPQVDVYCHMGWFHSSPPVSFHSPPPPTSPGGCVPPHGPVPQRGPPGGGLRG
jgi:hypothetical protein